MANAGEFQVTPSTASRVLAWAIGATTLMACCTGFAQGLSRSFAKVECAPFAWMPERLDYNAPSDQLRVSQIEGNHFDREVEALVRGKTGSLGADIDFLLRYVPNHPRGLAALVRLSLRENNVQPQGIGMPVECYFLRGVAFRPDDPTLLMLFGTYLARIDRPRDALEQLKKAESLDPNSPVLAYNLGLVYASVGDYANARNHAKRAYAAGIQLPGLRDKLKKAGQWEE